MCNHSDDFIDEGGIASDLSIPFLHKVTEYDSEEGVEFEVNVC